MLKIIPPNIPIIRPQNKCLTALLEEKLKLSDGTILFRKKPQNRPVIEPIITPTGIEIARGSKALLIIPKIIPMQVPESKIIVIRYVNL